MVNQPGTKHHGIEAKLKQESEIAEAHRNALAKATRTPRWCCRPRGRWAASDVPRRNLASRMVRLSAQGRGEAVERFAMTAQALVRRRGLNEEWRWRREKTEERKERRRRRLGPNNTAQKLKEATLRPLPRQRDAQTATHATGTPKKVAGREEESDERRTHGEINRPELAGWVRKDTAELEHALPRRQRR